MNSGEPVRTQTITPDEIRARQRAKARAASPNIPPRPAGGDWPLTASQRGLWLLDQMGLHGAAYNVPLAVRVRGALDVEALKRALAAMVERHESLRTRIVAIDGEPRQVIDPPAVPLEEIEAFHPDGEIEAALAAVACAEAGLRFDLATGPLLRTRLLQLPDGDHALLVTFHHIIADGASVGIFWRELSAFYRSFARGEVPPLAALAAQFVDFALLQSDARFDADMAADLTYWRDRLAGAPDALNLPTDRPRPPVASFRGDNHVFRLPAYTREAVRALCRAEGVTPFMALLAAFAATLSRWTGQQDVVIGTPVTARREQAFENVIGFFANTLALRIDLGARPTYRELVRQVRDVMLGAHAHARLSFDRLVAALVPQRDLSRHPIFNTMFVWQDQPGLAVGDLALDLIKYPHSHAKFDLSLWLRDEANGLSGALEFATDLFDPATAARLAGHFIQMLVQAASDPDAPIETIDMLPAEERARVMAVATTAPVAAASSPCLHRAFEAQVRRTPDTIAVECGAARLSYAELDRRANHLAGRMRGVGIGPERLVGICTARSLDLVVAVLGVLKAGGAYLPLDPAYPADRLRFVLADAKAAVVLADATGRRSLPDETAAPIIDVEGTREEEGEPPAVDVRPDNLAYVIYTSGSTGMPKGVALTHAAIQLAPWAEQLCGRAALERVIASTSLSFDLSVYELFVPLSIGGTVLLVPNGVTPPRDATLFNTVPSVAEELLAADAFPRTVQTLNLAGEPLRRGLAEAIFAKTGVDRLFNLYGPTEYTTYATAQEVRPGDAGEPAIGHPLPGATVHLLDRGGMPVPVGVIGEAFIGGSGLARNYVNRPRLTAERFVPDLFGPAGARLYRTGDLARRRMDGTLEFLGRSDHQIKLRGFRIELGEIETSLLAQPGVAGAAVLAIEQPSGTMLVAWVAAAPDTTLDAAVLSRALAARLPPYMLPGRIERVDALPLNANGKIDRAALAARALDLPVSQPSRRPLSEREAAVADIWAEVLNRPVTSAEDNFFELGGHSLLAVRVVARLRERLALDASLVDLFSAPRLADLAGRLTDLAPRASLSRASRAAPLPLSFAQQRLWLVCQLDGANQAHHLSLALSLAGSLDVSALKAALQDLAERHEALRARIHATSDGPVQHFDPPGPNALPLEVVGLDGADEATIATEVRAAIAAPFALENGPLARAVLVAVSPDRAILVLVLHHIIGDGWSLGVLREDLARLYAARLAGAPLSAVGADIQFADHAVSQRAYLTDAVLDARAAYWLARLRGAPPLMSLPTDRARPALQDFTGAYVPFVVERELTDALRQLARRTGTTLFMVVLAGLTMVLSRLSGQRDLVIGTATANRTHQELERLVGLFADTLALRLDLAASLTVEGLLAAVRAEVLAAHAHADVPFQHIVERLALPRNPAHAPVFQVMFGWQNEDRPPAAFAGLDATALDAGIAAAKFDLTLGLTEREGQLVGGMEYATALFDRETVAHYLSYLRTTLAAMAEEPLARIDDLPLGTVAALPAPALSPALSSVPDIPALFARVVGRQPEAVAVAADGRSISYAMLDERANRLARRLRAAGAGPDQLVGVCAEPSIDMIVALLAVLKAGSAYLPLDPAYPPERLRFMLEDARPVSLLDHPATASRLAAALDGAADQPMPFNMTTDDGDAARGRPPDWPLPGAADRLAYVIYTSGSTGRPKGVMVSHRNVGRLLAATRDDFGFGPADSWTLYHSFAFDFSVWEIWGPLLTGGRLVIPAPSIARDFAAFHALLCREGVTVLNQTPSAFGALAAAQAASSDRHRLRLVIFGGETLDTQALAPWQADPRNAAVRLVNMYGITETTVHVTLHPVGHDESGGAGSRIGRPIEDIAVHLLDNGLRPLPPGMVGEIFVAGAGVTRGYLGRPRLTAERFLPDPFGPSGGRLYRSGDRGRRRREGDLEHLGRADNQLKIRGYRIEPGEIEARLLDRPDVREAVVVARPDREGEPQLVAYLLGKVSGTVRLGPGLHVACANLHEARATYGEIFEQRGYLRDGITVGDGDTVIDVGANIGLFSLFVKGVAPGATVFAFEPAPETFGLLQANIAAHGLDVSAEACALSAADGEAAFFHYPGMSVNSGLHADPEADLETTRRMIRTRAGDSAELAAELSAQFAVERFRCRTRRLSSFIDEAGLSRIDLLKIDVEKAEAEVLAGIEAAHWPIIRQVVVEVHDLAGRLIAITALLESHGFTVTARQSANLADTGLWNLHARRQGHSGPAVPDWSADRLPRRPRTEGAALRHDLARHLPEHMVPAAFIWLDAWPLTVNGKLDRTALPAPDDDSRGAAAFVPPEGAIEEAIAQVWRDILDAPRIGRRDNFFDLGGHSLSAVRANARIAERLSITVPLQLLFAHPVLADFAAALAIRPLALAIAAAPPAMAGPTGLTSSQQRMWFLDALELAGSAYTLPTRLDIAGPLDRAALESSLTALIARHDSLRARFEQRDTGPAQIFSPPGPVVLPLADIADLSFEQQAEAETRWTARALAEPFDLVDGDLCRFHLLRLGPEQHRLLIVQHHIVSDGWSVAVMLDEIAALYRHFADGKPMPAAPQFQYGQQVAAEAAALAGDRLEAQLDRWRARLAEAPALLALPTDRRRPAEPSFRGGVIPFRLDAGLSSRLRTLARAQESTLFMVLLSAFAAVLARWSGQDDIVIGTMVANRDRPETHSAIGLFANSVPLRIRLDGDPDGRTLMSRVRGSALDAFADQDLPFEKLVAAIQPERDLSRQPIFQVMFLMQQKLGISARTADATRFTPMPIGHGDTAKLDLTLAIDEDGDAMSGAIEYASDLFDAATVDRMIRHFKAAAEALCADPERRLSGLRLLSADERYELLTRFSGTSRDLGPPGLLHAEFERIALERPDAVALIDGATGARWCYGDVDRWANRIARGLIAQGAGPEAVVGVFIPRSIPQVVAFLAVLKSGAAYMPLDRANPDARLAYMLGDSGARLVLADDDGWARLATLPLEAPLTRLAYTEDDVAGLPGTPPDPGLHPSNLAYVLYTSGSTGQPKGVVGAHGPMRNRLLAQPWVAPILPTDIALQRSSIGFGASIMEVLGPLSSGATLVSATETAGRDMEALADLIEAHGVTRSYVQPSVARALMKVNGAERRLAGMRMFTFSGEVLDRALAETVSARTGAEVINIYGSTEQSMESVCGPGLAGTDPTPIGRPMPNVTSYILDQQLEPVPIGIQGDLFIGGVLARGYAAKPRLTAQAFVPHPFVPGARLYRTGDLARWRADGSIEYLARSDHQTKVRGYRIELGEIETTLLADPDVRQAAVVVREPAPGHAILAAYVARHAGAEVSVEALTARARAWLPDYMVPTVITVLDALPQTVSGKIDRRALPMPELRTAVAVSETDPTRLAGSIAAVWREVLGVDAVGLNDNFFDLGGNSLLLLQLQTRLRETLGTAVRVAELFKHATVAAQAAWIAAPAELPDAPVTARPASSARAAAMDRLARQRGRRA